MRPGRIARRDGEYRRRGTANVFCGVESKAGQYFPKVAANRSSPKLCDSRKFVSDGFGQKLTAASPTARAN
jgi:hypothetical protein